MRNHVIFYLAVILVFGISLFLLLNYGKTLERQHIASSQNITSNSNAEQTSQAKSEKGFIDDIKRNFVSPICLILLEIMFIIMLAKLLNFPLRKIGQPLVIGEILAGIVLGPSLLGTITPDFTTFLFPKTSLGNIQLVSQIGLVFFMFTIGMELDISAINNRIKSAVVVSHASIIVPYLLGVILSLFLYKLYAPKEVSFLAFALFMGIAMSITAFPVLARIVQERGLSGTSLGSIAITCAAVDDISAWSILALVVAIVKSGSPTSAIYTVVLALGFIFFMFYLVKPLLSKFIDKHMVQDDISRSLVSWIFILLSLSALFAEIIGIHALFGGFLMGVILPENPKFRKLLRDRVEDFSVVFLLPLFFAFTGLRTEIGSLNNINGWLICLLIITVAVVGKLFGSAIAARFTGLSWKESFALGTLMNTRGLVELVVLNVGYDLGILSAEIFTMMVLMALITTFMAGPLLSFIQSFQSQQQEQLI
ncbi:MAG: cation:proton antiporter [Blastocatellia bacterium]|nr:cation:proton antiporter [Blastocatellia bacterium]MBL8195993.1 cation:proton antiporter [Blastocatellia bacterium]MBN8722197.1 cation:proton antiporter [Acidobacteriota bacterium]